MESWVEQARAEAGRCPSCGATTALPIVYGMPDFHAFESVEGQVVFAGCLMPAEPPAYACGACGAQWGRLPERDEEPLVSPFDDLD